jgi:hypothetical protein
MSATKTDDGGIRTLVRKMFEGSQAHLDFDAAVRGLTPELASRRVNGLPHTAWQLVWHIWFTQKDIIDYHVNSGYREHQWPRDYWPETDGPADEEEWRRVLAGYREDVRRVGEMLQDPSQDLLAPRAAKRTSLLRVAVLSMDHTAYHVGQLVDVKRLLGMR